MKQVVFYSNLSPLLEKFLENHITEGYQEKPYCYYLQELDLLSRTTTNESIVTKGLVDAWDTVKPYLSNRTKIQRHNIVRAFALFSHNQDGKSYVPDTSRLKRHSTFSPYIYTVEEMSHIISVADHLPYRSNSPTRHIVFPAVIRLLYSCGLRINEALKLKIEDVDLNSGVITIHYGKGGKDRFVPMHSSLIEYLKQYTVQLPEGRDWFFPSIFGHYSHNAIYATFREVLFMCHIPFTGNGPRIHDFRHTFAVHSLENQLAAGYDPMAIVPRLAAYLGHKNYRETCWYIHLTIASFPELSQKLDAAFSDIIPVVGGTLNEED